MSDYCKPHRSIIHYFPLFFLLCLSGNPIFSSESYSKTLLVVYSLLFILYTLRLIGWRIKKRTLQHLIGIVAFIFTLVFFQRITLGFVSYPGVFALILKILLGLFTLLYYQYKRIDFLNTYIIIMAFLAVVSLPFFILNQFRFYGIAIGNSHVKSLLLYTTYLQPGAFYSVVRNSGMFWEPGAFSGYLNLALIFIALRNGKFKIGNYRKEVIWICIGIITSMSTAGYVVLSFILILYVLQNYRWGKIIILPVVGLILFMTFSKFGFLQKKLTDQFINATELSQGEVSNTRFGSLIMDWQYIKARPIIGNGLSAKTRYRFNPTVVAKKGKIGNGNGMSNFIAYWGIPFFLFWLFSVYKFSYKVSYSPKTSLIVVLIIILILQGEQFLNFPLFLIFFSWPFVKNIDQRFKIADTRS